MKRLLVLLTVALGSVVMLGSSALAAGSGLKIGTMDLKKVMELSEVGQKAQANVKKKFEGYQAKLSKRQDELVALQGEIDKKRSVWSEDMLNQKERDLKRGIQDLQTDTKYADNDMQDFQKKQIGPILHELDGIIKDYGKAHGYQLILDSTKDILYDDGSLDVSTEIAAALDKKQAAAPAPAVAKPAPAAKAK